MHNWLKKLSQIDEWDFLGFIMQTIKWIFVISFGIMLLTYGLWLMGFYLSLYFKFLFGGLL